MIISRSFSERRKSGRYFPLEQKNYDLFINGKKIDAKRMVDIGPDGLKIFSSKFNAFKPDSDYEIEFKKGTKTLFKTIARVCWRVDLRFPLNTCLIGLKIQDANNEVAKFWVGNGYRGGFDLARESNLGKFKVFHNILLNRI